MGFDESGYENDIGQPASDNNKRDSKLLDRRDYMKLTGAGLAALGGFGVGSSSVAAVDEGGPAELNDWELVFEDTFESGSLDTSNWGIGFGWGMKANYSPSEMSADCVEVSDDLLKLKAVQDDDGGYSIGGVNSKGKVTFGPGSYVEAKVKVHNVPGSTSAFWSKPDSEEWPPEIDFMECPTARIGETMHNIHYSSSGNVGDGGSHAKATNGTYNPPGEEMHERFYVYGCEWQEDSIAHFVDGELVGQTTDANVTGAVGKGAPFYMMLNVLIGGWPPGDVPDDWSDYDTEMHVDWVRIWEQSSGGASEAGTDTTEDTDTAEDAGTTEDSAADVVELPNTIIIDGNETPDTASRYTFAVSDEVQKSSELGSLNPYDTIEGGEVSGRIIGGKDGYRFSGDITSFTLDGPADVQVEYGSK